MNLKIKPILHVLFGSLLSIIIIFKQMLNLDVIKIIMHGVYEGAMEFIR